MKHGMMTMVEPLTLKNKEPPYEVALPAVMRLPLDRVLCRLYQLIVLLSSRKMQNMETTNDQQ
jgi:hypothetical protein